MDFFGGAGFVEARDALDEGAEAVFFCQKVDGAGFCFHAEYVIAAAEEFDGDGIEYPTVGNLVIFAEEAHEGGVREKGAEFLRMFFRSRFFSERCHGDDEKESAFFEGGKVSEKGAH